MRAAETRKLMLAVAALAAVALAGCGDTQSTGNALVDQRNKVDSAFETVVSAQNDAAVSYSEGIEKTTSNADVKSFASSVISERNKEAGYIKHMQQNGTEDASVSSAAKTLGVPLDNLALSADGKPLAAPSSDDGYLLAMKANTYASMRSSAAAIDNGGPGSSQLARIIQQNRPHELEQINQLRAEKQ